MCDIVKQWKCADWARPVCSFQLIWPPCLTSGQVHTYKPTLFFTRGHLPLHTHYLLMTRKSTFDNSPWHFIQKLCYSLLWSGGSFTVHVRESPNRNSCTDSLQLESLVGDFYHNVWEMWAHKCFIVSRISDRHSNGHTILSPNALQRTGMTTISLKDEWIPTKIKWRVHAF